ncbi:unnamed protein product, partial [Staurois parvus]
MGPPIDPGPTGSARVSKWSVRPWFKCILQHFFGENIRICIFFFPKCLFFLITFFLFFYHFIFQHTVTKAIQCYHSNIELLW